MRRLGARFVLPLDDATLSVDRWFAAPRKSLDHAADKAAPPGGRGRHQADT
jgi:hypothetical protein